MEAAGGHVQLILAENRGAFLSLGSHMDPKLRAVLFTGGVGLALIGAMIWLCAQDHTIAGAVSLSLVVGGGLGNLADRVLRSGAVTDFIFVHYGPLRTGIFNLADVFITSGVAALLLASMSRRKRAEPPQA